MSQYLLAIDQGTTNSRAIIFDAKGTMLSQSELALKQFYPHDGWVEQDPEEMFSNTIQCCQAALQKINVTANEIAAIGITNQRETTIVWDKSTGKPIYPAIVWQDRRTIDICKKFSTQPIEKKLQEKTGLLLDPYFSATKLVWILENVSGAREKASRGELAFGTVDTFLLWKLTNGKSHATDATNASRTMLFNIHTQTWDQEILTAFDIPENLLPQVLDSSAHFGETTPELFGKSISISAMVGDQQAATIGQTCFHEGMVKTTFGTGGFMLLNTGEKVVYSKNKLLSTVAYRLNGNVTYGLEGSFFCAGSTIKWLRDKLKLIQTAAETENLARSIENTGGVYLVPAFTGLGAPYWNPAARGVISGLTLNSGPAHIARAALEAVVYQTLDLLIAMQGDSQTSIETMRADGGMAANNWLLEFLSSMLNIEVQRPACIETTALGAAYLAGLQVGIYQSLEEISFAWQMNARFVPHLSEQLRQNLYAGWVQTVAKIKNDI